MSGPRLSVLLPCRDAAEHLPQAIRSLSLQTYRDFEVISFPPPSSGGIALIETLNILEGMDLASLGAGSSAGSHRIVEALKFAFADRAAFLGDADFVPVPVAELTGGCSLNHWVKVVDGVENQLIGPLASNPVKRLAGSQSSYLFSLLECVFYEIQEIV